MKSMHLDICQKWKVGELWTVIIYICYVMCNNFRFQSVQNHCKESHKSWHWNNRNEEEASIYHKVTKWTCSRKKVDWCQTRWGYSIELLFWKTKYQLLQQVVIPTNASHVKLTKVDKTPNTTLNTGPITPPNTPSKPIICNILSKRHLGDTEKANVKRIQKDVVTYNFHDEIDDSQLLTVTLN